MAQANTFAPAIVSAAEGTIAAFEGSGLGVAVSVSFLMALGAAMGPLDLLLLIEAVGFTMFLFFQALSCI